ncbi:MAG: helix-turn-helix domain-containing protein [Defluviitaleaceae bacterium]|nr:helix-turn-helix domain-containing protein [Defluviitaleaceae bacterium]MCL2835905.1 helix-turn-helix domain-containing protein [Defluviitaleaceae bacterium]
MSYPRIRDLREDADLTQIDVAKVLHMHKTTYVRYESGQREIPLNIAILLAKYYRVSLDYIAGLVSEKNVIN